MFTNLIDFFLPAAFRGIKPSDLDSAESLRKFKLNIIFCLTIGTLVLIIFLTRLILEPGAPKSVYLNLVVIGMMYLMPFGIKFFSIKESVFYMGCSLSTVIVFFRSLETGGIISPIVNWLTIFPLIGLLIVGRKIAILTLIIVCSLFFIIGAPEIFNLTVSDFSKSAYIKPVVLSFVTLVVFMLAYLYETQRKHNESVILRVEQELASNRKLASLGGLSGGLAHEINNPLTILSGRLATLNKMLKADEFDRDKMLHACASAKTSVNRIDSIVNALRTFSREEYVEELKEVRVGSVLEECLDSFKEEDSSLIKVNPEIDSMVVKGNSVLLQRVFNNLIGNSLQATQGNSERWIEIDIAQKEDPLILSFKDSGKGIPAEVAEHIMDPFFTTKGVGLGSGLGLSLSLNIMTLHGGSLKLNQDSENTEFLIIFSC